MDKENLTEKILKEYLNDIKDISLEAYNELDGDLCSIENYLETNLKAFNASIEYTRKSFKELREKIILFEENIRKVVDGRHKA